MDNERRQGLIDTYRTATSAVESALAGITDDELDRRPPSADEWTAREVVHHLADSESMAYTRLRRLIADDEPVIQGYDEPVWARRLHYERPIAPSLAVLGAVRTASLQLLEALTDAEWQRTGTHSESGPYSVEGWLEIYANHPREHAEQITRARGG
jgi:hypothetical protein